MFEAYVRNKYTSTGVIQWMLNNAWPSMIWHLYDWYLMPSGGYFGAKKANELLHVQYSEDDNGVYVTNSMYQPSANMKVRAQVLNLDMAVKFEKEASLDAAPDSSVRVLTIPDIADLSPTYFVRVWLMDSSGKPVSDNFYWRSTKPDVLDWSHTEWFYTDYGQESWEVAGISSSPARHHWSRRRHLAGPLRRQLFSAFSGRGADHHCQVRCQANLRPCECGGRRVERAAAKGAR